MNDFFDDAARKCGFGGRFRESLVPAPFDRIFAHHGARFDSYLSALRQARPIEPRLDISTAFADSSAFNAFATVADSGPANRYFLGIPYGVPILLSDVFLRIMASRDVLLHIGDPRSQPEPARHKRLPLDAADLLRSRESPIGLLVAPPDAIRREYANYLIMIAVDFLFAHEYQHVDGGHLRWMARTGSATLVEFSSRTLTPRQALTRQALELDADAGATKWSLKLTMSRSNDHWRVPPPLQDLLATDESRLRAWLFATGVLFRLMAEAANPRTNYCTNSHPRVLARHYCTLPAATYILGGLAVGARFAELISGTLREIDAAFRSITIRRSRGFDVHGARSATFRTHMNRLIDHWTELRAVLGEIAAEWGGSNAPEEYFERIPDGAEAAAVGEWPGRRSIDIPGSIRIRR